MANASTSTKNKAMFSQFPSRLVSVFIPDRSLGELKRQAFQKHQKLLYIALGILNKKPRSYLYFHAQVVKPPATIVLFSHDSHATDGEAFSLRHTIFLLIVKHFYQLHRAVSRVRNPFVRHLLRNCGTPHRL